MGMRLGCLGPARKPLAIPAASAPHESRVVAAPFRRGHSRTFPMVVAYGAEWRARWREIWRLNTGYYLEAFRRAAVAPAR